jgi:mevalonate pyrophosphate decarboxylase
MEGNEWKAMMKSPGRSVALSATDHAVESIGIPSSSSVMAAAAASLTRCLIPL